MTAPIAPGAGWPHVVIVTAGGLEHGGGIGRMVGYLADEWDRDPAAPRYEILDPRGPGPLRQWPGRMLATLARIRQSSPAETLAYIHVAGRGSTLRKLIVAACCRARGLPIVLHLHDYDYEQFCRALPAPALWAVRWMFGIADRVIVLGRDASATVTGLLQVPAERVAIVPNAVPAPPTVASIKQAGRPVEILFLGQLSERKGVHDLIAALAAPALANLDWHATLAGGGPHQMRFEQEVMAAGLADRVSLPGWVDRPGTMALLRQADILVLPSYAEGMAMSVLEGMAYGLCVVSTPAGALAEVVEDGRSGLLVTPGAVPELAAALARAVGDGGLRERLGRGAAEAFRQGFDAARYPARIGPILAAACGRVDRDQPAGELAIGR